MGKYDLSGLKILFPVLPWHELWVYFHPMRSNRGLKPQFTWEMLIKTVIVQWHVEIVDDVDFAQWIGQNPDAVQLCGMPRAPSHDVISRFTKKYGNNLSVLHEWFDLMLEEQGVFVDDNLAGDGTNVPLHKPQSKADPDCFGAKSDNEKFYGLWLMLVVSVRTGLVRAFNQGKARIGQQRLLFDLLVAKMIQTGVSMFLDGIFDVKDIHAAVMFDQECLPMITYNAKNSACKSRKELSKDDWRGDYNPHFKDGLWMIIECAQRTSVERTNSLLKLNTTLKHVYERSRRLQKRSNNHLNKLIIGAIVLPQIEKLTELHSPKPINLLDYLTHNAKTEATI